MTGSAGKIVILAIWARRRELDPRFGLVNTGL